MKEILFGLLSVLLVISFILKKISNKSNQLEIDYQEKINEWANEISKDILLSVKKDFPESKFLGGKLSFSKESSNKYLCSFECFIQRTSEGDFIKSSEKKILEWDEIPNSVRASLIKSASSVVEVDFNFKD